MYFHFAYLQHDGPSELFKAKKQWLYEWDNDKNENEDYKILGTFRKINLFVGANNSGKSRFLRGLLKSNEQFSLLSHRTEFVKSKYQQFHKSYKNLPSSIKSKYSSSYNNIRVENIYYELVHNYHNFKDGFSFLKTEELNLINEKERQDSLLINERYYELVFEFLNSASNLNEEILFIMNNQPQTKKYIPILRSLHVNGFLQKDNLKETVKKNYGIEKDVFTGLELFDEILELKTSPGPKRKKVKEFEKFLSKHFFNNKEVEITSNSKSQNILLSIDDVEHPLYDIGDGIQSLIILLFPIFIANHNDWFFIEEPEINLHPGLQRIFMEALLKDEYLNSKNLKYFFTTHSNHMIDITLDNKEISIFQFEKIDKEKFLVKNNVKPNKEILDLLGVQTSSVFLANTSIWVEGPTDRKYLSKFLNLYSEFLNESPLKEDIDYAFFEYGGNLIQHYLFEENPEINEEEVRGKINSFALSNKIFLLADNDGVDGRSSKGKRRKALEKISKNQDNFTYRNTIFKEIENLLPKRIISQFTNELIKDEKELEKIKSINFSRDNYKNVGLGHFYEELFLSEKLNKKAIKSFKAKSGTLTNDYKMKLSDLVINSKLSYSELIEDNDELKEIIETLYLFIKK